VQRLFVTVGQRVQFGQSIARLRGRSTFDVIAPFAGTVVERCVSQGQMSGPRRPLVRLTRLDVRHVRFAVPTSGAPHVAPGVRVTVTAHPGDLRAPARIVRVAADRKAGSDVAYAIAELEADLDRRPWVVTGRVVYVFADFDAAT
jgi:multidrug efflux pump subunit AcrA (membrane-fusion protein)